ncbi:MAG: hypothetical protein MR609_03680 [Bacteroidales bacterium]|nr:hypothetical protein [Bacteroidales bacterium]
MKKFMHYTFAAVLLCAVLAFAGCHKIPVGYLVTENAKYADSLLYVYHTPAPSSSRATTGAPWVSLPIQGVSGTAPVNFEYASVKTSEGGDAAKFAAMQKAGHLDVRGGLLRITQEGVRMLPLGAYTISLRVYNEGYSNLLSDVFTFVVGDTEPDETED